MMTYAFRLLGEAGLSRLCELSEPILSRWTFDWIGASETAPVIQAGDPHELNNETRWHHFSLGDMDLWYPVDDGVQLLRALVAGDETDDDPVRELETVITRALADLSDRFFGERSNAPAPPTASLDHEPPPDHFSKPGAGFVQMSIGFTGWQLRMLLGNELVWRLTAANSRRRAASPELVPAKDAINHCRVTGMISLGLGSCTVEDLHALAPNDVITSDMPLTTAFELCVAEYGRVAACRLGRRGDNKAVVVERRIEP